MADKFIADVHCGKLAKLLRILGFDTTYNNSHTNKELLSIAAEESRILLSRNITFNKSDRVQFFFIQHEEPTEQLKQVLNHFNLKDKIHPFTRCTLCNGILEDVSKENILQQLQENTLLYYHEFWKCSTCGNIYWKGSHFNRMKKMIEEVKADKFS